MELSRVPMRIKPGSKVRAAILAVALMAGTVTVGMTAFAPHASACVADTDGDCYNPNYGYWHVQNTDANGLYEHATPNIYSPNVGSLKDGTAIEVVCQVNGTDDPFDLGGLPYTVWDKLDNGDYVYDGYFVSSPGDGFHIVLHHC